MGALDKSHHFPEQTTLSNKPVEGPAMDRILRQADVWTDTALCYKGGTEWTEADKAKATRLQKVVPGLWRARRAEMAAAKLAASVVEERAKEREVPNADRATHYKSKHKPTRK